MIIALDARWVSVAMLLCAGLEAMLATPANGQQSREEVREHLLRQHYRARVAHVLDDVKLMVRGSADSVTEVNRGNVSIGTPARSARRFSAYFAAVDFLEWDDIKPPIIHFSRDGTWASVVVQKRVRLLARDAQQVSHEYTSYAWTELWRQRDGQWERFHITSTDSGERADTVPLGARQRAHEILAGARRAMGSDSAIANVAMLTFTADAKGPRRNFQVEVRSARDGRAFMRQRFADSPTSELGVALDRSWARTGTNPPSDSLDAGGRGVLTGHEVLLLAIAPEARFANPRAGDRALFRGLDSDVVEFVDGLGNPIRFFYHPQTHLPGGVRVNAGGQAGETIDIWFDDWRRVGGVLLPHDVQFHHGAQQCLYTITGVTLGWLEDRQFRPD